MAAVFQRAFFAHTWVTGPTACLIDIVIILGRLRFKESWSLLIEEFLFKEKILASLLCKEKIWLSCLFKEHILCHGHRSKKQPEAKYDLPIFFLRIAAAATTTTTTMTTAILFPAFVFVTRYCNCVIQSSTTPQMTKLSF